MAKLVSQSCGELQPAVCLSRGNGAILRRPEHSWTSGKPQKQATAKAANQGNFQHQYMPQLLVNVYSYRLMVKSVSCCCVRGRRLFSNPVTFMNLQTSYLQSNLSKNLQAVLIYPRIYNVMNQQP